MEKETIGAPPPAWLSSLQAPKKEPVIATLCAEGGMGKTTLASLWPAPIFIPVEDGSAALVGRDGTIPAFFPIPGDEKYLGKCTRIGKAWVLECMNYLAAGGHPFKTLVLDTITRLADVVEDEITKESRAKSINQANGGYGAGYKAASTIHEEIRDMAEFLKRKQGMNVLFLAHAVSEKVSPPDAQEYTRYSVRIHKESITHYTDNVDMVAFIKLKTFVIGAIDATDKSFGKAGKATTSGQRVITCYPNPAHISKNRFSITKDIDFVEGVNPFQAIL